MRIRRLTAGALLSVLVAAPLLSTPAWASDGAGGCALPDKPGEICIQVTGPDQEPDPEPDPGPSSPAPSAPTPKGEPTPKSGTGGGGGGGGDGQEKGSAEVRREAAVVTRALDRITLITKAPSCDGPRASHLDAIERYSRTAVQLGFQERAMNLDGKSAVLQLLRTWTDAAQNRSNLGKLALDAILDTVAGDIADQRVRLTADQIKATWNDLEAARTTMDKAGQQYVQCAKNAALGL